MSVLPLVWAGILVFAVFAYVVMDGFDLGIGILFPRYAPGRHRDLAMNSIAPVWDGNETWLVLGGGGLMAAFPLAYAVILPAVYAPIIAMLLALTFRGVAFEFRWRDAAHRAYWDFAFAAGSTLAALCQGIVLGALLQGIAVAERRYAGGWWDWLSPFSVLCGVSLVIGYAWLGACWLVMKTTGPLQAQARRQAELLGLGTFVCIVAVSIATPFLRQLYYMRWFAWPNVIFTSQVPMLLMVLAVLFFILLRRGREHLPFVIALSVFALCFMGLGISVYPDIVPGAITIREAAAPPLSQGFVLAGAVVLIPIIVLYTGYSYWIFRGKVSDEGYH